MRERERRILKIITRRPVTTQAELVGALRAAGVEVTQATVSRDIKRLGLIKVPGQDGQYRYQAAPTDLPPPAELLARLRRAVTDYVTEVDAGSGLVVVKTATGSAGTVAEAIDEMAWPDVVGTVAGDNTILVVPRRAAQGPAIIRRIRGLL